MLVMCQRFGDLFLFGQVWQYSTNQTNIIKVGSKSWLLTCSSNKDCFIKMDTTKLKYDVVSVFMKQSLSGLELGTLN